MKISVKLHSFKEQIFKFYFFHNKLYRGWGLFLAGILFVVVLETILFLSYCAKPYSLLLQVAQILFSVSTLVFGGVFVCFLCLINMRGIYRNIFFIFLFTIGVIGYITVANNKAEISEKNILSCNFNAEITTEAEKIIITSNSNESYKQQFVDKKERFSQWVSKIFVSAVHHSHMALAAFFPSRGTYEIEENGTFNSKEMEFFTLFLYFVFHTFVYIFTAYFIVSHWGYRTTNRLRFWLTRDDEKNVFWCVTPGPKMLTLAKDIIKKYRETAQPIFTVEEAAVSDPKSLFQEMNYHGLCLKLRKPDQIHSNCLCAARHFFLSEDSDWNINMANSLLEEISKLKLKVKAQLYIRITNDARKIYYTRWAEQYKNTRVEIIFIDECALIVDKFTQKYHVLDSFKECIGEYKKRIGKDEKCIGDATVCKENGFNFLIIGFGGLGQEVLKHLICDTQFFTPEDEIVPVKIDVVEKDAERIALFRRQFNDLLERFNGIEFIMTPENIPVAAGTEKFYSFFEQNHKKYDRVIVALGDAALNVEIIAQIENIVRKNIDLSLPEPEAELQKWKNKLFLISPELCKSIFSNKNNMFTLFGEDNKIFNYLDIINGEMFELAKKINCNYCVGKIEQRQKLDSMWSEVDFYNRQSSYAAGLGLENIKLLLKLEDNCTVDDYKEILLNEELKERLGKIEHNRWWAYMLGCGYSTWQNPHLRPKDLKKAKQTDKFLRHATMIEWEDLPKMDEIFPDNKTFYQKDLEIIENLPLFYRELNMLQTPEHRDCKSSERCF